MTDLTSRARQLLVYIGLEQPASDPPEIDAQYERLVAFVADHLRQVAAEALKEAQDDCQRQAMDRRRLQEIYERKFGEHSLEQKQECHTALVLEALLRAIEGRLVLLESPK